VPNFVEIGETAAEVWRFLIVQDGGGAILNFLQFQIFNGRRRKGVELRRPAKFDRNRSIYGRDIHHL